MKSKVVTDFLNMYNRDESELLTSNELEANGVFSGEEEFIEFAENTIKNSVL
ncbi:hypothetical protein [Alkalihalobacterium alkalinitrilicum]|uniref:hypothetical protein n=1 Tax=Alkalihalobacterium alkalinitrilicum TaxID=427920 RepID=UPI001C58A5D9|nr:hypothetical protein [Alkalihalobacterium alkalinitrilicum]